MSGFVVVALLLGLGLWLTRGAAPEATSGERAAGTVSAVATPTPVAPAVALAPELPASIPFEAAAPSVAPPAAALDEPVRDSSPRPSAPRGRVRPAAPRSGDELMDPWPAPR